MVNKEMQRLGNHRSVIRELFEFGKLRAKELGADSVFDYSIGNPSAPAPKEVGETLRRLAENNDAGIHGYSSAQGDPKTRLAVANDLNARFGTEFSADNIYMTCGAAAGLAISFNALNEDKDEFIILAPYFPEYSVFVRSANAVPVIVPCCEGFGLNLDGIRAALSERTKGIIVNSPNNPSGVVYSESELKALAALLDEHFEKTGKRVFIIADEPYRELVFDGAEVPFIPCIYKHTIVCYSYSKSLSLAGERIGYIAVSPTADASEEIYSAILGAGRALGYICAPMMFQRLIAECASVRPDVTPYLENRNLLYDTLTEIGFTCVKPMGAFYLFAKAPNGDSCAFSELAKTFGLLLVPADDFGADGWVRIACCVQNKMIKRSIPAFKLLFDAVNQK